MNNEYKVQRDVKFYEDLITKTLNKPTSLSKCIDAESENVEPPNKRKKVKKRDSLVKNKAQSVLSNIELVIGIYRLLTFNPRKYANKWNLSSLISILSSETTETDSDGNLTKWFIVKCVSLVLSLTPIQEKCLFEAYFKSQTVLDQCFLRFIDRISSLMSEIKIGKFYFI